MYKPTFCSLLFRKRAESLENVVLSFDDLDALRRQDRFRQFLPDDLGVKVAQISLALYFGYERCGQLLLKELVDVETLEPWVEQNIIDVIVLT